MGIFIVIDAFKMKVIFKGRLESVPKIGKSSIGHSFR
jgi:hypothetical protein